MNKIRVALPGYNAFTDTNPDHFALDSDTDNILIKEFARKKVTITAGNSLTVAHNLGYVPFFLVYCNGASGWQLVPHFFATASVPPQVAEIDTTNLYITNNEGASRDFIYYIFYDNIDSGNPTFIPSTNPKVVVGKSGINVLTEKNPNNFIFHSDLNTFKILKEANVTINYTTDGQYSFSHSAPVSNATSHLVYMKFPDGFTALLPGLGIVYSKDSLWTVHNLYMDSSKIYMTITGSGSATTLHLKYYIFETPLV